MSDEILEPKELFAKVHFRAQAMRRKLTRQAAEFAAEQHRRFLEGLKNTEDCEEDNIYKMRLLLRSIPVEMPVIEIEYED